MFNHCETCKKYGETTCGNDPECRCYEPIEDDDCIKPDAKWDYDEWFWKD